MTICTKTIISRIAQNRVNIILQYLSEIKKRYNLGYVNKSKNHLSGLRGIDPMLIEKNIREIVNILKSEHVIVVLAGMRMVENMGPEYTAAFDGIYPRIARDEDLIFIPFFLEGVGGNRRYNQDDGIHPTAEGYRLVTDSVYPYVLDAIRKKSQMTNAK